MTDAVMIVLREVLEAMLVCCVLMASSHALGARHRWLLAVTSGATLFAFLYAANLSALTEFFDGRGQEFVNIFLLLVTSSSLLFYLSKMPRLMTEQPDRLPASLYIAMIVGASAALIRELAEIFIYVFSYGIAAGRAVSVISGAAIGAGVGISIGIFLYYALLWFGKKRCLRVSAVGMGLISAGLLSQATRFLVQSGLLPGEHILWDSSWLLSESSMAGELLHALIGYDATPGLEQMLVYFTGLLVVAWLLRRVFAKPLPDKHALR
ncbi:MAG: FTR1 family protein [Gammaproteobacteria bacterium]|nr:FTR1 family protein [Gammaproteobacteria bacterium]